MSSARRLLLQGTTALLICVPSVAFAQVQPQGGTDANVGMLTPTTTNAAAVSELKAALEDFFNLRQKSAAARASRALELEPGFGIARAFRAVIVGGPTAAAETQRAASDAAAASAGEAVLALAVREQFAGRAPNARRLFATAVELLPNDRTVALWRAWTLPDTARVTALRDVVARYPDFGSAKMFLAFYLTPLGLGLDSIARANGEEAIRVSGEAVRLAPQTSAAHANLGHVLLALRRFPEAQQHLTAATSIAPKDAYAYELLAQIHALEGRIPEMRLTLDSALAWTPNVGATFNYKRARALTFLHEGNAQQAQAELAAVAREAEEMQARGQAGLTHMFMASVSAAMRDTAGVEQHLAAARTFDPAPGTLADYEVTTYSLSGQAVKARRALETYIRVSGPQPSLSEQINATRTANVHRATGLVLLAERKPQEAIAELRQGGSNPYATLGIIEALKMQRKNKEADAERSAFFARKEFSFVSTAVPIIKYRARR